MTRCGSYSISLKIGKHAYSFDLMELLSVAGQSAIEKCTSRQTGYARSITTVSHLMTETDWLIKHVLFGI
jgi:hypothetical protein